MTKKLSDIFFSSYWNFVTDFYLDFDFAVRITNKSFRNNRQSFLSDFHLTVTPLGLSFFFVFVIFCQSSFSRADLDPFQAWHFWCKIRKYLRANQLFFFCLLLTWTSYWSSWWSSFEKQGNKLQFEPPNL